LFLAILDWAGEQDGLSYRIGSTVGAFVGGINKAHSPGRVPHVPPDFLWSLVALAHFMRLSLLKAAHAVMEWSRVQEIRVA
jgi:hypothetical protein